MQVDWQYLDRSLRDGTSFQGDYSLASDQLNLKSHVLDRLRPFQYRYKSAGAFFQVPCTSTLDTGGVCHTGRAATLDAAIVAKLSTTRCVKQSETNTTILVACEDGTSQTLSKEQATPLPAMVQAVQQARTRCSQCSPPPSFVSGAGRPIQAESSFGIPFRVSASRAAAADLMRVLGNASLNLSAWTSERFMATLLRNPAGLFLNATLNASAQPGPPPWPSGDWVFCNTTAKLQAGACDGYISESDWRADRFTSCYREISALTRNDPSVMATVDVCLIDAQLNGLCTAVSQAQALVQEANCLASGSPSCALKPFLYQPSMWDVSNREFVYSTVSDFYSAVAPAACPATAAIIEANNLALLNRCAATPITAVYLALQGCRDIVDAVALLFFYASNILVDGLLLTLSSNKALYRGYIVYYWRSMIAVVQDLATQLSDLLVDMLFHMGSLGPKLYAFLEDSCGVANQAYRYWLDVWCNIVINMLPEVLGGMRSVASLCEMGFAVVNTALDSIFLTIGTDALQLMYSLGFSKGFQALMERNDEESDQATVDDLKDSKQEGVSADKAEKAQKKKNSKAALQENNNEIATNLALTAGTSLVGLIASDNPYTKALMTVVQPVAQVAEQAALLAMYPSNWTLFDFSDVYLALDTLEVYLTNDRKCLAYQAQNITQILNCTFPSLVPPANATNGAELVATRCWADAQPIVGTSNLLSCTASDTCYASLTDRDQPLTCASCPDAGPGFSAFGCSALTQMCTCGVPTTQATRCTSNYECYFQAATCQLLTGLGDMSYGNQKCSSCTKQVQCTVTDSSGVGTCSYSFQAQTIQQCSALPGLRGSMHLRSRASSKAKSEHAWIHLPGCFPEGWLGEGVKENRL